MNKSLTLFYSNVSFPPFILSRIENDLCSLLLIVSWSLRVSCLDVHSLSALVSSSLLYFHPDRNSLFWCFPRNVTFITDCLSAFIPFHVLYMRATIILCSKCPGFRVLLSGRRHSHHLLPKTPTRCHPLRSFPHLMPRRLWDQTNLNVQHQCERLRRHLK